MLAAQPKRPQWSARSSDDKHTCSRLASIVEESMDEGDGAAVGCPGRMRFSARPSRKLQRRSPICPRHVKVVTITAIPNERDAVRVG